MLNPLVLTDTDRPARCACGLTGTLREMRAHLRAVPDGNGHVLISNGGRAFELSILMRRAAIAWATADREVKKLARVFEAAELAVCEIEDRPIGDVAPEAYEAALDTRDLSVEPLRAAMIVRDSYEDGWRKAARDLLDEMAPEDDELEPGEVLS